MPKLASRFRQLTNALRYLAKGDVSGLFRRLKWYGREFNYVKLRKRLAHESGIVWGILCTPHTLFIARAISERLASHGIESEIVTGSMKSFDHDFYIVLCAQMFGRLPPANKRVIFQLEQSVSSRWFTAQYKKILADSLWVLEYSLTNVDFLAKNGLKYPKVHYLPIGASLAEDFEYNTKPKKYDFVFYGDSSSSERRSSFLDRLKEKYSVKICNDLFGRELYDVIKQSKIVINIHYYDGALLEMPRICECISLGVPVLSEGTMDQDEYPELEGAVKFFDEGSVESMMTSASEMLHNLATKSKTLEVAVSVSAARFNFMMDRFLVAIGVVPANVILEHPIYVAQKSDFFALSLPETIERRRAIAQSLPDGCELFDGIRHSAGWIGCGCSFNALSRYAVANEVGRLTVIEDDVELPGNFNKILCEINEYLNKRGSNWDIFSGLMADVHPDAKIISVDQFGDRTYVTIDKMTSTVFNIYNKSALEIISKWNPLNTDAVTNTIDRYLERQEGLRVVVALPFIAGHKEDATSTLWGFENERYTPMIAAAQQKIEGLVREWLHTHASNDL
ncbi:methyltransferase type 11 [Ochrobactrum soli]|uniref:methyltransferase type 11 n=1 Tax=Brucella/Ochrobactrum group TaxID=2826938 RepID=UPI000EF26332|nr:MULTISPECIES: methyltransferase type 11 [Brucella]MDX4076093.1 methyltransferase type 11 [Brucella sp. NBRC 113783]RLL64479.1 methyltransferase type 11 [[Ochrobactrum] soli]